MKKIINYFFNINKDKTGFETITNWMWIILSFTFITLLAIWSQLFMSMTPNEIQSHSSAPWLGLAFIIWIILFIAFLTYKVVKNIKRRKLNKIKQTNEKIDKDLID